MKSLGAPLPDTSGWITIAARLGLERDAAAVFEQEEPEGIPERSQDIHAVVIILNAKPRQRLLRKGGTHRSRDHQNWNSPYNHNSTEYTTHKGSFPRLSSTRIETGSYLQRFAAGRRSRYLR